MRRNAFAGLINLFSRPAWRESSYGPEIRAVVLAALDDEDSIIRFHAAHVATALAGDSASALELLRPRVLEESDNHVAAVLINALGRVAASLPAEVDLLVGQCIASDRWRDRLVSESIDARDASRSLVSLTLWLAVGKGLPEASAIVDCWMENPAEENGAKGVLNQIRPWLDLPSERSAERDRAFGYALVAAERLESLRTTVEQADRVEIYRAADALITQIYFASGAFGNKANSNTPVLPHQGFATSAMDVLERLTGFKEPSIIHHVVETLGHLASTDPVRAFLLVDHAVRAGDAYTYDSLAAAKVVSLIERYLAEFRDIVTTEAELLSAIRNVLDAFVRVGWPGAVALSYRLGDAFR